MSSVVKAKLVKPKILITEDDLVLSEAIGKICEDKGCVVRRAKDGQEALDILGLEAFDLVITDVRMPRMDGLTLLKSLKKADINVPVILMSGFSDYTPEEIDDSDGVALIDKPFTRSQIEEVLDQYLTLLI